MSDHEKVDDQVEDLQPVALEAEQVKGGAEAGGGITAEDDWESPLAAKPKPGSSGRGGWDGNHNDTLVAI